MKTGTPKNKMFADGVNEYAVTKTETLEEQKTLKNGTTNKNGTFTL